MSIPAKVLSFEVDCQLENKCLIQHPISTLLRQPILYHNENFDSIKRGGPNTDRSFDGFIEHLFVTLYG